MHRLVQRPTGEQVDAGRLELSRARSEQGEAEAPILDMAVHFVQEIGQALDLVDDHPAARGRRLEIHGEEGWIGEVVLVAGLVEQIDVGRIRKLPSRPGALANPADAQEKEALPGWPDQPRIRLSRHVAVIFQRILTSCCQWGTGESISPRTRLPPLGPNAVDNGGLLEAVVRMSGGETGGGPSCPTSHSPGGSRPSRCCPRWGGESAGLEEREPLSGG